MTTPAPSALLVARARYARSFVPSALVRIASSPPAPPDIGGRRSPGVAGGGAPGGEHMSARYAAPRGAAPPGSPGVTGLSVAGSVPAARRGRAPAPPAGRL